MKLNFIFLMSVMLACSGRDNDGRTKILRLDSLRTGAMIKYMNDDTLPVVINLDNAKEVFIESRRPFLDLAIQDARTPTEHYMIFTGYEVAVEYDRAGNFRVVQDVEGLPFDSNYPRKRDSLLFRGSFPGMRDFARHWQMLEESGLAYEDDEELMKDLSDLGDKAMSDLRRENIFIDSLLAAGQMSSRYAEFYKTLNSFDSLRIHTYPYFSAETLEAPAMIKDKEFLTYFDDWVDLHHRKLDK